MRRDLGSKRYVEFMGGAKAVLAKARESYKTGDYRWVAEVVNHVVSADPSNQEARRLEADALAQLGYQAESTVKLKMATALELTIPQSLLLRADQVIE